MASDLAKLPTLCEQTLVEQLHERFNATNIYTYVADILIALNPYSKLGIYQESTSADYNGIAGLASREPHIFAVADAAYQNIKRTGKRQCFLISGESGAGKTESTKLVLQHILRVSRHKHSAIQDTIEQINPILESLGNARTVMNHNSSRFGKYIQLYCLPNGLITGMHISQYMLERSRIVKRNSTDFNFHIFYYMFGGLDKQHLLSNFLVKPDNHRYLNNTDGMGEYLQSGKPVVLFEELVLAFSDVGFSSENISTIWRVLAAVLHTGDIKFLEEDEECSVRTPTVLNTVSRLLLVDETTLTAALTSTVSITRGESIRKLYSIKKCEAARDGLAKALYGRLFDWVVTKINMLAGTGASGVRGSTSIDILDIFGFENFAVNSFEQLCINIANEQLQYFFNQHIFTWEQAEYEKEGIETELVVFANNEAILDLLLARPVGVLQLLDEESRLARGTEATFVEKVASSWKDHPNLAIPPRRDIFNVTHYAGKVSYQVCGLLEKNRETLSSDVVKCVTNSSDGCITEIFCGVLSSTGTLRHRTLKRSGKSTLGRSGKTTLSRSGKTTLSRSGKTTLSRSGKTTLKRKISAGKSGGGKVCRQTKKKEPTSLAIFFRNSLKDLMRKILEAEPHFIRCIKPNNNKAALQFDIPVVQQQLRYTGVLETTKIRQLGYSNRLLFSDFLDRFSMLVKHNLQVASDTLVTSDTLVASDALVAGDLERVQNILCYLGHDKGWAIGTNKVFLKYWFVEHLEKLYDRYIADVITVQKVVRGFVARRKLLALKAEHEQMRAAEEARRAEEAQRQADILAALQAEQRLKEHLDSIRSLTIKSEQGDRAATLDLRSYNLRDITSAIFDTDLSTDTVKRAVRSTESTLSSCYGNTCTTIYRDNNSPDTTLYRDNNSPDTLTLQLHSSSDDITFSCHGNTCSCYDNKCSCDGNTCSCHDNTCNCEDDIPHSCNTTDTSGFAYQGSPRPEESPIDNVNTPPCLATPDAKVQNTADSRSVTPEHDLPEHALSVSDNVQTEVQTVPSELQTAPTESVVLRETKTDNSPDATHDNIYHNTLDSLDITLDTLDLTLEAELEKLARWSRDFSTLDGVETRWSRDLSDLAAVSLLGERDKSSSSPNNNSAEMLADEVVSEPWLSMDSLTDITLVSQNSEPAEATSLEHALDASEEHVRCASAEHMLAELEHYALDESDTTTCVSQCMSTSRSITHVSTFSLDTLDIREEVVRQDAIRSEAGCSAKDHSLKLTQALSFGEVAPGRALSPSYVNTADTESPGDTGPVPGDQVSDPHRVFSPGELYFSAGMASDLQDSGIEMQRFDSLDRCSCSSLPVIRSCNSSTKNSSYRNNTGSLECVRHRTTPHSNTSLLTKDKVMSSGGLQSSGSMQSFDDLSCSSPIPSCCTSPDRSSCVSMSSIPDLPSSIRSRSAASNISDHVLTTLDRPRTKSFGGAPIKQAWLQVCCYERDTQTGNFLIDKQKVQIDGQMLHPDAVRDPDLYRISMTGLVNDNRNSKTEKLLPEIGHGVIITRDKLTGDVTLTKVCRKDVFLMNDSFLALKHEEKCKGKHTKLEQNTTYTIFNKQQFVDDVRNGAVDLTKIHTIGQVAIAFLKINANSVKGVPCWVKVQCLEAMNLLKNLLSGSTPEQLEWLRKAAPETVVSPRRSSIARLSFGSKSSSKSSLKDSKSSVESDSNTPIPRCKSKSQLFRNSKKALSQTNGASPEPRSNRNSGASQHLEPFTHNYESLHDMMDPDELGSTPPMTHSTPHLAHKVNNSKRLSSPHEMQRSLTTADVSSPLSRGQPLPLPET